MVDIGLILIMLVVALVGAKKGLISVVMKLVGLILAIVLASYFYKGFAVYMYNNFSFGKNIENTIITTIKSKVIENVIGETENNYNENLDDNSSDMPGDNLLGNGDNNQPIVQSKISMNFSEVIQTIKNWGLYNKVEIDENVVVDSRQEGKTLIGGIAYKITMYIMRVIAFAAIFVCVIIITAILSLILNLLFMLPGLKIINKTGGFIAELFLFLIKILIILAIISFLQPIEFMADIINYINTKTLFVRWLYNNNLIFTILNRYL